MAEVKVDTETCVGAGQCVLSAPDVFDQDDDGIVRLLDARPGEPAMNGAREATERCPSQSITVRED
jgi:ferredoxin